MGGAPSSVKPVRTQTSREGSRNPPDRCPPEEISCLRCVSNGVQKYSKPSNLSLTSRWARQGGDRSLSIILDSMRNPREKKVLRLRTDQTVGCYHPHSILDPSKGLQHRNLEYMYGRTLHSVSLKPCQGSKAADERRESFQKNLAGS